MREADVFVIGGGAIGVCCAYFLRKAGLSVALVEKGGIGSGCSEANAGLIVPSHIIPLSSPDVLRLGIRWMMRKDSPFYLRARFDFSFFRWLWLFRKASTESQTERGMRVLRDLSLESTELFSKIIAEEGISCDYRHQGWLMAFRSKNGFRKAIEEARLLESHLVEVEVLEPKKVLEMEPSFRQEGLEGGVFFAEDSHLDPAKFVRQVAEKMAKKGLEIHLNQEVKKFELLENRISLLRTNLGDYPVKHVVLAAGAWSASLLRSLGIRLPLVAAKGYSISIERPADGPRRPLYLSEAKVAVTPLNEILRFGGTLELGSRDLKINSRRIDLIRKAAREYLTGFEFGDKQELWSGLRPCSPDGLPIVGRFPKIDNLVVATGHGMLGISLAPVTGKVVSQLIRGERSDYQLEFLSPERFM